MSSPKPATAKASGRSASRRLAPRQSRWRRARTRRRRRTTRCGSLWRSSSALADGRLDLLTPEAQQALMAALCKCCGAQAEAGKPVAALTAQNGVTPTDVMVTASALLRAADLAVFELGMWQSWTGR